MSHQATCSYCQFSHFIFPVLSSTSSSLASSVEWRTQSRASFLPGYKNTLRMKTVLKEEGLKREQIKTASSHHHHRSLLMGTKKTPLLMDVTPQSQAPVTQVKNVWYNQKCEGLNPSAYLHCSKHQFVSTLEPTTSRASLNFQECVLSRPPLNRSHLHLNPLDAAPPNLGPSNSLFSPPSTSSAPGPFTTGFSLIKEIKDNLSQHEDDNISTTSGFSSRASDKGNWKFALTSLHFCAPHS